MIVNERRANSLFIISLYIMRKKYGYLIEFHFVQLYNSIIEY